MTIYTSLMRGATVAETAEHHGLSRTWIYRICKTRDWPRNPPLTDARRSQVIAASRHLNTTQLAKAFSYAPNMIKRILKDSDRDSRRGLRAMT